MSVIVVAVPLHVIAGAVWILTTLAIATRGMAPRWLLALQMGAALLTILDGIGLWHALHADRNGPAEHWLAAGTFLALIAIGPQLAVAGSALLGPGSGRLAHGALHLTKATAVLLVLTATAMVLSQWR